MATHLLFDLQLVDDGSQFREDLVCLLVVLELGSDEVREVAERFGGVEDLNHIGKLTLLKCRARRWSARS